MTTETASASLCERRKAYADKCKAETVERYVSLGWEQAEAERAAERTYSAAFVRSIIRR